MKTTNALHSCLPFRYENGAIWSENNGNAGRVCVAQRASKAEIPGWEKDANMRLLARAVAFLSDVACMSYATQAADIIDRARKILATTGILDSEGGAQ